MPYREGGAALALCIAVMALGAVLAGCDRPQAQGAAKSAPAQGTLPSVTVSKPLIETIVEWDEYTGRFEAIDSVEVRARVSGYLDEIAFKDGQTVTKGTLLFVIDPRPFERVLEQAEAELAQAQTKADNLVADVERGKPLVERRIMSEKAFDDRANLLKEAQAAVKVARAKVATAALDVSFTRITAPIDGRISRTNVSPGNWVSAGGTSNPTLLTTIVGQDPIYVYFDVSENNFIKYRRLAERDESASAGQLGALVEVALPDETGFAHRGKLDFIDNRLDAGTATLRVRATLDNKAQLFSPGMFARVRLAGSPSYAAVLLPDEAIGTDQGNKYVLVVGDDGVVTRKAVRLGPLSNGMRVIREGAGPSDWVIVNGLQRARPGQKVEAVREPLKASRPKPASLVTTAP